MRTQSRIDVLFPKTRRAILAATFGQPERRWYMRELARHLRVAPSSLQRELASLVHGGILHESREGKHVYFKAATGLPFFEDLHRLILKTAGLADVIRSAWTLLQIASNGLSSMALSRGRKSTLPATWTS